MQVWKKDLKNLAADFAYLEGGGEEGGLSRRMGKEGTGNLSTAGLSCRKRI